MAIFIKCIVYLILYLNTLYMSVGVIYVYVVRGIHIVYSTIYNLILLMGSFSGGK